VYYTRDDVRMEAILELIPEITDASPDDHIITLWLPRAGIGARCSCEHWSVVFLSDIELSAVNGAAAEHFMEVDHA
jgi:hypothetical protein